ncbi:MAG: hypothetical protein GC201_00190 [Alphaproteobacteria bacterium]|nr:hypothetical protein [Alphaproteobacteria bacterium]
MSRLPIRQTLLAAAGAVLLLPLPAQATKCYVNAIVVNNNSVDPLYKVSVKVAGAEEYPAGGTVGTSSTNKEKTIDLTSVLPDTAQENEVFVKFQNFKGKQFNCKANDWLLVYNKAEGKPWRININDSLQCKNANTSQDECVSPPKPQ